MLQPFLHRIILISLFCNAFINSSLVAYPQNIPDEISFEIDSLLISFNTAKKDTDKVNILFDLGSKIYSYDLEQGISYIQQSIKLAESKDYMKGVAWGYYLLGYMHYYETQNYSLSLENFFLSLTAAEYTPGDVLIGRLYTYIANLYSRLEEVEREIDYYKKSIEFNEKYGYSHQLSRPYNNLANCYFSEGNYSLALKYYGKSLELDIELNDEDGYTLTLNNIASCYTEMEVMDTALIYLEKVKSRIEDTDNLNLILLYHNNLGYYYNNLGAYRKALVYFNKTLELAEGNGYEDRLEYTYDLLSSVYEKLGMYDKAYESYLLYDELKGRNVNREVKKKMTQIEMKYELDKKQKEFELEQKRKEVKYIVLSFCLFLFLLILAFIYKRQKYKIKIQDAELKTSETERKKLSDEVQFKNRELMNFALQIIQKNNFIKEVKERMKVLKNGLKKEENLNKLNAVELFINQSMDIDKARKEFQMNIELLHEAFVYKLNKQFPNLTENEKRLALLLRLNYSSKKIAALLNISSHGVDMGRYRLRKKLCIEQDINLSEYLNSI